MSQRPAGVEQLLLWKDATRADVGQKRVTDGNDPALGHAVGDPFPVA